MQYPDRWQSLDVTLCHDWLTGMRGGERVLEILCEGFPNAPIVTLIHNASVISDTINRHRISTSGLQRIPGIFKNYRAFLPCFPTTIACMPRATGNLVISTSHCVAKSLKSDARTRHLCYCFTPMRYAWTFQDEYFAGRPVKALLARPLLAMLRNWDRRTASRVDRFVAISEHVRKRIETHYGREADVVYPPVNTHLWTPGETGPKSFAFDLVVSALVPYKRVDLAVQAYSQSGFPLKVVGVGGELERLRKQAAPNIEFLEWQADEKILELYRSCRMLVFPGEEDFGIVPLEAQSCGRPVCAYHRGGALETVKEGETGVFFSEQDESSLLDAVDRCAAVDWDSAKIRAHAENFGVQRFIDGLNRSIEACLNPA